MNTSHGPDSKIYFRHFLVLFLGLSVGIAAAFGISLLPLEYGHDLEAAQKLGIVSVTILDGYSKTRDLVNYIALITLPFGLAMLFWYIWVRKKEYSRLSKIYALSLQTAHSSNRLLLTVVLSVIFVISFNINFFFKPIVDWSFPIEEGVNLFAASNIINGGVQSLDFTSIYGPMLVYPLAVLMKLIGQTVLTDRIYTYLLNLAAYGIVVLFFYRTIRVKYIFVVASLLYVSVFTPFILVSPNTTYLRVALGLLPILLVEKYLASKTLRHLWICGLVAGQCLLFSQEVGICSIIALASILFVNNLQQKSLHRFFLEISHVGCAILTSVTPMLIYFAYKGALSSFLIELSTYPNFFQWAIIL